MRQQHLREGRVFQVYLRKYRSVAAGKTLPAYVRTSRRRVDQACLDEISTPDLWAIHNGPPPDGRSGLSVLDLKAELAGRMLRECTLCERQCAVDRTAGERGYCGVGEGGSYFFEQVLWGEERPLVPSHEIFFSGCNMRCRFCYSRESVLDPSVGRGMVPVEFADLVARRRREGAANLNLIGGEPTVCLPIILECLRSMECRTPVVWNSNFFMSPEAVRLLYGIVDLYVGDFRFGNDRCASEVADTDGYFAVAARNFEAAAASGSLIIRHLVLPGHVDCCLRPIAEWVAEHLPDVPFSLMLQYTPCCDAWSDPALGRWLTDDEERQATGIVTSLGLNTSRWNRPLPGARHPNGVGSGPMDTTVTIRPDGRVVIMHLHGELLDVARGLGEILRSTQDDTVS